MENNHGQSHNGNGKSQYSTFIWMLSASFVAMYLAMYLNTYELDHVYFSLTRFYMTCLGISAMALIMFLFMVKMYTNRAKNMVIILGSIFLFVSALTLVRSQKPVGDVLYMQAMIPHHSIAILTSKRADLKDPEVRSLADKIVKAQKEEIMEMKAHISRLQSAE